MTVRLRLVVAADGIDVASGRLWAAGALGIEEQPIDDGRTALLATFAEAAPLTSFPGAVVVVDPAPRPTRPFATTTRVGPFVISPPWEPVDDPSRNEPGAPIVLSIDPGEAFGHGAHATTRLVLAALADLGLQGRTLADIGCGSGVVSVAAAALGASTVVAADNDPAAIAAARGNIEANRLSSRVEVIEGDAATFDHEVDIAVVNVTIDVHERIGGRVAQFVAGEIVVSGVLHHQHDRVIAAYPGFEAEATTEDGEWCASVLVRSGSGG